MKNKKIVNEVAILINLLQSLHDLYYQKQFPIDTSDKHTNSIMSTMYNIQDILDHNSFNSTFNKLMLSLIDLSLQLINVTDEYNTLIYYKITSKKPEHIEKIQKHLELLKNEYNQVLSYLILDNKKKQIERIPLLEKSITRCNTISILKEFNSIFNISFNI